VTPTPTPLPDYGTHIPTSPMKATDWLWAAVLFGPPLIGYSVPTILAIWRRNSRMGLVIFYNLGAFMIFPWILAMTVVLGEPSRRPRAVPVWTPEQAAAWSAPPELPPNVTPLRPPGESEQAKAGRLMREWGRQ
jgi:hypothetical protein